MTEAPGFRLFTISSPFDTRVLPELWCTRALTMRFDSEPSGLHTCFQKGGCTDADWNYVQDFFPFNA